MAIDTREKRMSMLNFGDGTHSHVTFEADGTISADDRFHLLDLYSGFVSAGGVPPKFEGLLRNVGRFLR